MPTLDEAIEYLVAYAAERPRSLYSNYGYGLYLDNVILRFITETERIGEHDAEQRVPQLSPIFLDAAWELCRMGVLRPGVRELGENATERGGGGGGYSLTEYGAQFVANPERPIFALLPGRFTSLIQPFRDRMGPGFLQRAAEGMRCYRASAYLAACSMWGAATESILLAIAIAKVGDEKKVLNAYKAAGGRQRVVNMVVGQSPPHIAGTFGSSTRLLSYWRDDASHGLASGISEVEAHEAVVQLIRFAQFVDDNWDALTT